MKIQAYEFWADDKHSQFPWIFLESPPRSVRVDANTRDTLTFDKRP